MLFVVTKVFTLCMLNDVEDPTEKNPFEKGTYDENKIREILDRVILFVFAKDW